MPITTSTVAAVRKRAVAVRTPAKSWWTRRREPAPARPGIQPRSYYCSRCPPARPTVCMSWRRRSTRTAVARRAALVAVLALAIGGCGSGTEDLASTVDPGVQHVHGLAYDAERDAVLAATHSGLFQLAAGEYDRIGDNYQDTMAFTIVDPGRYLASGHPGGPEQVDLPAFLGLIESSDGGESWETVSLQGKVDFHLLQAAGSRLYGYGSDWRTRRDSLYLSADRGKSWTLEKPPEALFSLVVSPEDPELVVASGRTELFLSRNGGRDWRPLQTEPGLLSWPREETLYRAAPSGSVSIAGGPLSGFEERGNLGFAPTAFAVGAGGPLYVSDEAGEIFVSSDSGSSWAEFAKP